MNDTLTIKEHRSPLWIYLAGISIFTTIIFFGAYWFTANTFWAGIFRIIAFAGFAGTVLALLRIQESNKTLRIETDNDHVMVKYLLNKKMEKEELFEKETIKNIQRTTVSYAWDLLSMTDRNKYIVSFTDTDTKLSMFTFSGRDLVLSIQDSNRLDDFFNENNIPHSG